MHLNIEQKIEIVKEIRSGTFITIEDIDDIAPMTAAYIKSIKDKKQAKSLISYVANKIFEKKPKIGDEEFDYEVLAYTICRDRGFVVCAGVDKDGNGRFSLDGDLNDSKPYFKTKEELYRYVEQSYSTSHW